MVVSQSAKLINLLAFLLLPAVVANANPWNLPEDLTDQNMQITFEVHAPWNILDGTAQQVNGKLSLLQNKDPGSLQADLTAQDISYKAGLSVAGRLVSGWLKLNPPTPARFIISDSRLECTPQTISSTTPCPGSVSGKLNIWRKDYTIDLPIEMQAVATGFKLIGTKAINWGEYGFGDPESTIANLKPVIKLNFLISLPS